MAKQVFNDDNGRLCNNPADLTCTSLTATGDVAAATVTLTGLLTAVGANLTVPVYANEAAALVGGLTTGDLYMTSAGVLMVCLDA